MINLQLAASSIWEQAAHGSVPLVVAALITNTAFAAFEEVEQRVKILCNDSSPEALQSKFAKIQEDLEVSQDTKEGVNSPDSQHTEAPQEPWDLLLQFKRGRHERQHERKCLTVRKPSQVILRKGPNSAPRDFECLTVMLQDIEQHIQPRCRPTCIVRLGTPFYAEISSFLTHDENGTNGFRCCYGLQMLLDTYKSYLLASERKSTPPCCRLQALKFAQEALPNIRAVLEDSSMPCRCCHTLAFHLENVHHDFKTFLQEKVFDLYFQSPWVCGSHILEMLEMLFYYGLRLFSYRHYVGSVVHVYNILRECTAFQPIPLLENLCDTFSDILFPGGRPKRSFKACCLRYMGGRLRFDPHASDHKSGSHQIWIPARTAKATAGYGLQKGANDARFEYRKISLLHHLKERGYHLDQALWDRVYHLSTTPPETQPPGKHAKRNQSCAQHAHEHQSPQTRLHHLQTALLTEFAGDFPIVRINFFQIYLSCVRIVSLISDRTHQGENEHGRNCLCFLDAMLEAADRYRDNTRYRMEPFGCRELVGRCKEAILEVLEGRGLEEFLWEGV